MAHEQTSTSETDDILLYILSFFIPPIPVLMRKGCGFHFFLNILLTLLAGFPGIIHAVYIVYKTSFKQRDRRTVAYEHDAANSHHRKENVQHHGQPHGQPQQQYNQAPPQSQGQYVQQQHHQAPPAQQQQQYTQPHQGQHSNAPGGIGHQVPPNYGAVAQDSYPSERKAQYKP